MRTADLIVASAGLLVACGLVACGASSKSAGKYPAREPGCEILVFRGPALPTYDTDNIGTVRASCGEIVSDEECLRELKDQACQLGADTLWGVPDAPTFEAGKKRLSGRAAHQR